MSTEIDPEPAHVLIVDDTEANRILLERRLQRQGHHTATAEDGLQALGLLQGQAFDLILLDIMMPGMNGFELLERLQADIQLKHVPVILISALDDIDSMARGIAMGADDYLPKPFNRHILNARVNASLARKRLHDREQLYARSLEREMDIAREIQSSFLPQKLPSPAGWQLAAWFEPARRVGGDFYDAFEVADQRLVAVIGDVCDKGVGAALFMAVFRSLLRALAERMFAQGASSDLAVCELVQALSSYIQKHHDEANMFATLFVGVLDGRDGRLTYVNAGHEPAMVAAAAGGLRARLEPTGPAVGLLPGLHFGAGTDTLAAGESLVLFTDGITDARDVGGASFSAARLGQLVGRQGVSAQEMVDSICDALHRHAQDTSRFDDSTLLVVRRCVSSASD